MVSSWWPALHIILPCNQSYYLVSYSIRQCYTDRWSGKRSYTCLHDSWVQLIYRDISSFSYVQVTSSDSAEVLSGPNHAFLAMEYASSAVHLSSWSSNLRRLFSLAAWSASEYEERLSSWGPVVSSVRACFEDSPDRSWRILEVPSENCMSTLSCSLFLRIRCSSSLSMSLLLRILFCTSEGNPL